MALYRVAVLALVVLLLLYVADNEAFQCSSVGSGNCRTQCFGHEVHLSQASCAGGQKCCYPDYWEK
ncbi:hypothetical protein JOB18_001774 [Solea senegalensis]|uniref:Beta-defensin n=1 Tax=Solea senegalensis TaxID=28829 RepID=A0AAV6R2G0_SOLSE|nr:hypothetical protein JOB18_001774 [Solea senegalensis]